MPSRCHETTALRSHGAVQTRRPTRGGRMRQSKIMVPPRPPAFIERDAVRAALEHHSASPERGPVVLVSAPTGYGKTAAVADWVRATPDVATSWVALDE